MLHGRIARHRWRRLHRLQLRAPRRRAHRRPGHRPRQADLRRQPARRWPTCPPTGSSWSSATSPTPPRSSRWWPPTTRSCTSRPSRTTTTPSTTPSPFIRTNLVGTFTLLEAVRKARRPVPPRLHRRGVRRPRARRPEALHRGHAVPPQQPLLRRQGRLRPPGAGLGPQLRRARDDLQLLQQLRPLAARREVHPAPDHRAARGRPAAGLRQRPATCATGSTPTTTARAVLAILERGRIGETYLVGADGERTNLEVVRAAPAPDGPLRGRLRARRRPRRPRPPLRHRVRQAPARARLAAALRGLRAGPGRHHRLVPGHRGLVGARTRHATEAATPRRASDGHGRPRRRAHADPRAAACCASTCAPTTAAGSRRTGSARR